MTRTAAVVLSGLCFVGLAGAAPPDAPSSLPTSSGVIALNSLPNPSATLATAAIADAKDTMVGAVHKIHPGHQRQAPDRGCSAAGFERGGGDRRLVVQL